MTNSPLVCITLKKTLFLISTPKVCREISSILDRLAYAMTWVRMKRLTQRYDLGLISRVEKILRIRLCMIMCLSLDEAWAPPGKPAGLLANISNYSFT